MTHMQLSTKWFAALALIGMLLVMFSTPRPAQAATGDLSARGEHALSEIAACAASSGHVLAAIVVDESSSLRTTDPGNARVGAIESVVDSLQSLQASSAGRVTIEASLATFSGGYTELVPWGVVADRHADLLLRTARADLPGRNVGAYTDYRAALGGAQTSLAARSAAIGSPTCSVILWFTDGQLDVPGTGEAEAWGQLCEPQGLVEGIRRAGSAIVAVALAAESNPRTAVWREQLRAIAEGYGTGSTCGATPLAAGSRPGAFLRADEPGSLRRLFAGVGSLLQGGAAAASITCPGERCTAGTLPIPLDMGVNGFRAVLDTAAEGRAQLVAPDGTRIDVTPGSSRVTGADVVITVRDGLAVIAVDRDGGAPRMGVWTLETDAPVSAPATVDLYYVWGVSLEVTAPEGIVVGERSAIEVRAVFPDGSPVIQQVFETFDVALVADGAAVPLERDASGATVGWLDVPAGSAVASVSLSAVATATTMPSHNPLGAARTSVVIATALPAAFPALRTPSLVFPTLAGARTAAGVLELTGAERGATRACLAGSDVTGPSRAGGIAVTAPDCLDIPAGGTVSWPFEITTEAEADGSIDGTVGVSLTAVDGQSVEVAVDVAAVMTRPVNEPLRWGITALLVALALSVPFLIGWASNYYLARFTLGPRTRVAVVPVVLSARGLRRADGSATMLFPDDFRYAGFGQVSRSREVEVAGLRFGRTLPIVPFREPSAWFTSLDDDEIVASTDRRRPFTGDGRRAHAGFGLASSLYLTLDPRPDEQGDFRGRLVCLGDDDDGLAELIRAQESHLASSADVWSTVYEGAVALAARLAAAAGAGDGPDGPPSGGAGGPYDGGAPDREGRAVTGAGRPVSPASSRPLASAGSSRPMTSGVPAGDARPPSVFGRGLDAPQTAFSGESASHPGAPAGRHPGPSGTGHVAGGAARHGPGPDRSDHRPPSIFD